jgi:hypothetical protein
MEKVAKKIIAQDFKGLRSVWLTCSCNDRTREEVLVFFAPRAAGGYRAAKHRPS